MKLSREKFLKWEKKFAKYFLGFAISLWILVSLFVGIMTLLIYIKNQNIAEKARTSQESSLQNYGSPDPYPIRYIAMNWLRSAPRRTR